MQFWALLMDCQQLYQSDTATIDPLSGGEASGVLV
jgi:hypothetical protein